MFSEKGYLCVPLLLSVLTEVAENYVPENQAQDDQSSIILSVVTNVFQKILEVMARRLRKDPEEGQEVWRMVASQMAPFTIYRELGFHFGRIWSHQSPYQQRAFYWLFGFVCADLSVNQKRTLRSLEVVYSIGFLMAVSINNTYLAEQQKQYWSHRSAPPYPCDRIHCDLNDWTALLLLDAWYIMATVQLANVNRWFLRLFLSPLAVVAVALGCSRSRKLPPGRSGLVGLRLQPPKRGVFNHLCCNPGGEPTPPSKGKSKLRWLIHYKHYFPI